jgi:PST family polysaccharide transporter
VVTPEQNLYFGTDHLKTDLRIRSARGGAVALVSQGLKFTISMVATVVLARLLSPQDYGLIGMVIVITGFISMFKDVGLSVVTVQREEINHQQISTLFWINVGLGVSIMLMTMALAPVIAWFYGDPRLLAITMVFAVAFLFGGLTVQHDALLRRQMRFVTLSVIDIVSLLAAPLTSITMAWRGAGYWALVFGQLATGITNAIGVWIACRWRPGPPVRGAGSRSMLRFGANLTGYGVVSYFSRNLDKLLIGRVWGARQLGLYARAYQLVLLPIENLSTPFDAVALTSLSKLTDSPDRYRRAYLRLLEKVAILTMPIVAFMMSTSDWLVLLVLGSQWIEAGRIFALLGLIGMIEPIANTMGWLMISQGRTRQVFQWGIIDGAMTIMSVIIGLPWGAFGVAASYSIVGFCLRRQLLFWFVGRAGPVRASDIYGTVAPSAYATLGVLIALFLFRRWVAMPGPLFGLSVSFAITVGITLLVLLILPRGRRLLQDIKTLLPDLVRTAKSVEQSTESEITHR